MAKSLKLPGCPYCHKRISYIGSMFLKTKGEYSCSRCKCISNVVISRTAYAIASAVCIAALLIVVFYTIGGNHGSFLGIACVLAPFLIFYLVIPFFVRLVPCKDKSAVKRLLDRSVSEMPNEAAYQAAVQSESKPVKLDVDEDFSAKFMRAKSHNSVHQQGEEEDGGEMPSDGESEIRNTTIAFEINHDGLSEEEEFPGDMAGDMFMEEMPAEETPEDMFMEETSGDTPAEDTVSRREE